MKKIFLLMMALAVIAMPVDAKRKDKKKTDLFHFLYPFISLFLSGPVL